MGAVKRVVNPSTNATGIGALAAAVYAAVVMIWHVAHHHGVIDPQVLVGGAAAIWLFYTRFVVTPVKDPKAGSGEALIPVSSVAALKAPLPSWGVGAGGSAGGGGSGLPAGSPGGSAAGGSGGTGVPPEPRTRM